MSGTVYLAVVIDAWSRRVVGWSIADHIRAEFVADADRHGNAATTAAGTVRSPTAITDPRLLLVGVRQPARSGRPARLDGHRRRRLGQRRRRVVLRFAATASSSTGTNGRPAPARSGDLPLDRGVVQPDAAATATLGGVSPVDFGAATAA